MSGGKNFVKVVTGVSFLALSFSQCRRENRQRIYEVPVNLSSFRLLSLWVRFRMWSAGPPGPAPGRAPVAPENHAGFSPSSSAIFVTKGIDVRMNFLQRFFAGRNGSDQLCVTLLIAAVIALIVSRITSLSLLVYLYYLLILLCLYRSLSRNLPQRQRENAWFLKKTRRLRAWRPSANGQTRDRRAYKYLKCPNCGQRLRVPRGKGKLLITCSGCKLRFYKKV